VSDWPAEDWPAEAGRASNQHAENDRGRITPTSGFSAGSAADQFDLPVNGFGSGPAARFDAGPEGDSRGVAPGAASSWPGDPNGWPQDSNATRAGAPSGPPPGFEPVPAPPSLGTSISFPAYGNPSATGPDSAVGNSPVNSNAPTNGNGNGGYSFRQFSDEAESGLRPFPGDGEPVSFADSFQRADQFPDADQFPSTSPAPDVPQIPEGSPFTANGHLDDDTDQFPPVPHGDPR
jgi:hypothetical protein